MANANTPFGFRPVAMRSGSSYSGSPRLYVVPAADGTALYLGDPVKLAGTGDVTGKYPGVIQAATGDVITGVVVGFQPLATNLELRYRAASTLRYVWVVDDADLMFEVQEINSGTALTTAEVGLNANFSAGSGGSTTTGFSGFVLNNSGEATTNTLDIKIHALVNRENNDLGLAAKWLVSFNRHQFANQVAGI